jgi:serine/threonine-protein kinase RsbW
MGKDRHEHTGPAGDGLRRHRIPCLARQLPRLRQELAKWAAQVGMVPEDVTDMVLASHEAMANVIDHAYADGNGDFDLDAVWAAERQQVTITVTDHGRWPAPAATRLDSGRGRGLKIIRALAHAVALTHDTAGTRVVMSWRTHPV